jgi:predicted glycoside hydrolase/deacetylase ChbG (UPF0249 family)
MYTLKITAAKGEILEIVNSRSTDKPHQAYRMLLNQQGVISTLSILTAALEHGCQPKEVREELVRQARELLNNILGESDAK